MSTKEKLQETLAKLDNLVDALKTDASKFIDKDNKAAGTRTRATAMDISKLMKEIRTNDSEIKNA